MADDNPLAADDGNGLAAPRQYAAYGNPYGSGWYQQNIVPVYSPSGVKFMVNKAAADAFTGLLAELEGTGYKIGPDSGGYNLRNITGGTTLSPHAYGLAIDINPAANPYSKTPQGGTLTTNLPPNISQIAAKYGLQWGGDWQSLKDPMHFEFGGAPTTMLAKTTAPAMPTQPAVQVAQAPAAVVSSPAAAPVAPINPLTSLASLQQGTPLQRLMLYRQLAQLFAPPQRQQQQASGPMVGGVDASIPLRV